MGGNIAKKYPITEREQHWRDFWHEHQVYAFDLHSDKPIYSVDTPPPYVNADHLHSGHIMSYSQAEFVVRYKRMQGYNVYYPMGFDDNGLPTEKFVEQKYNLDKDSINRSDFIAKCLEETEHGIQTYRELWDRLGISVDWNYTYSTIAPHATKNSQWSFIDLYQKGLVVERKEPIIWDTEFQTALAQTDLDEKEEEGTLNDIEFKAQDGTPLVISTTRPELIPACVALFYNPEDERYQHLNGQKAIVPITEHEVEIKPDEAVNMEYGTGLMMVCTWGDTEDIDKWKRHNLETRCLIDEGGTVNETGGPYQGMDIHNLRDTILEDLREAGVLQNQEEITHVVQVSDRSGRPAEFVMTNQWFVRVLDYKEELLEQGRKLNWYPEKMFQAYQDWVESLKWDWCISRQRYFGVPLPVWYHVETWEVIVPEEDELPVDPTEDTPRGYKPEEVTANPDVMDTWMTSSVSPLIASGLVKDEDVRSRLYPMTLRPQGLDIIRTWLFYTVTKSYYHHDILPFRDAMISGQGLDSEGRKISKRLQNFTDPHEIMAEYGADALRYWATGANLGENLRYSEEVVKKGKKTVTKLFNVAKFADMHVSHLAPEQQGTLPETPASEDRWILHHLNQTITTVTQAFEEYEYFKARSAMDDFFWHYLTDNYMEFIKHRLYDKTGDEGEASRDAARQVLYIVLKDITKLYAPVMPYITEEIYQSLFRNHEGEVSIHRTEWPVVDESLTTSSEFLSEFNHVLEAIEAVRRYKSQNEIPLGKELEEFSYEGPDVLRRYKPFIERAVRVKTLTLT